MDSSLGVVPHHRGLRVSTIRWAALSARATKAPADTLGPSRRPLKPATVAVMLLGSSTRPPANIPCPAANGRLKIITAWRSSTPRRTESTSAYNWLSALANAGSSLDIACTWFLMSSHVIGVPSVHTAFGLIVYVTTCGSAPTD